MTKPEKRRMSCVNHRHFVWLVAMVTVVTLFCIYISQHEVRLLNPQGNMFSLIVKNTATSGSLESLQLFYDDIKCIKEQSNKTCSFPLLTQFHQRCGYFAELTSWKNISKGFPAAAMSAHMCKLPLVTSAPRQLREYITKRNITGITVFGDSQGMRYSAALLDVFKKASFKCKLKKQEPTGYHMHLDYYTKGTGISTNTTVKRGCTSCNSYLHTCSHENGTKVALEYISMKLTNQINISDQINITVNYPTFKQNKSHPLCQGITQAEYLFKYYLKRTTYPQLLLIFPQFAHNARIPLVTVYDGISYLMDLIITNVPATSSVILYNGPPYNAKKDKIWSTSEGAGYNPNEKMQAMNHFLSKHLLDYHKSRRSPPMYSFFDLYHMGEQLREAWAQDHVHSQPHWYKYVVGYTVAMLPSIPMV